MNPDPTAAAVCIACNVRAAAPDSRVCDECRERARAAAAQMAEAKRLTDEAAATKKPARRGKPVPGLDGALERERAQLAERVELGPAAPPVKPKPLSPMTNPPAGRGPKTCQQCGRTYGERPDHDDAAIRCGSCVRENRAAIRALNRR